MNLKIIATAVYGVLVGVGGVIGFMKAGSIASLMMGSISALLILVSAFAMYKHSVLAHFSAGILAALLMCFFAYRFFVTSAFMPSGLMVIFSIALLAILCIKQKKATLKA